MRVALLALLLFPGLAGCVDRADAAQFQAFWSEADGARVALHGTPVGGTTAAASGPGDAASHADPALDALAVRVGAWHPGAAWNGARGGLLTAANLLQGASVDAANCARGRRASCAAFREDEVAVAAALSQAAAHAPGA
ncbi:MAG: hypothetical protein LC624_03755 [Halobacteriales archaeon]|nr:hypothetical protein [Halobacteriales archaeon]